ncbi:MAG: hypothetical protein K2H80_00370, partial [Ureaplasma sp.]|nr:hypothetical protein [Ureaplasma sp.]
LNHIQNIQLVPNQISNVLVCIKSIKDLQTKTNTIYKIIEVIENNTSHLLYLFENQSLNLTINNFYILEIKISKQKKYTINKVLLEIKNE